MKELRELSKKIKKLVSLDAKIGKLPRPSPIEKQIIETEERFEATYYSSKLEGSTLTKEETRKAVLSD